MSDLPPPSSLPDLPPPAPPEIVPVVKAPQPPVVEAVPGSIPVGSETVPGEDLKAPSEEKTLGLVMYLLPLLGLFAIWGPVRLPVVAVVAPLVLWLLKKDQSTFLDKAGKEVVNFNICVVACFAVVRILYFIGSYIYLGWLFAIVGYLLWLGWIVSTLLSAYNANSGTLYRFPFTYRIIK